MTVNILLLLLFLLTYPWPDSASELYRPRNLRLSAKLVPTSPDRLYHVVSVKDPYGRILGFLYRTCGVNPIDNTHYANKHTQTSLSRVGLEPTITVF
jgi:hypothetical protein